jgi:hypothetical protein
MALSATRRPAERKQTMIDLQTLESGFAYVRQRSVLHLFRLSNRVLLVAIGFQHAPLRPRATIRAALWTSEMLEKIASALLFGERHDRRKADFGEEDEIKRSMKDDDVP